MTPLEKFLAEGDELAGKATSGWRAGRPDMQSYTIGGIAFKNLYCDAICRDHEAGIIYGENSVNDSQFFADARQRVEKQAAIIRVMREALSDADNHWHAGGPGEAEGCTACDALAEADRIASEDK